MATLTDRTIQATKATVGKDEWISDGGARGAGRLYLRVQPSGRRSFYYRYAGPQNDRQSMALGEYSQKGGRACLTLTEARDKSGDLSRMYQSGIRDLKGHLEAEQRARERELKDGEETARRAEEEAKQGSLRNLLNGYTAHLERAEKTDFKDVKSLFRLHVFEKFPELADRKASDVKARDLRDVLAKLIDADKGRTAAKLRSYMRAAFAASIKAEYDPAAHIQLMGYGIEANPCDALPALSQFNVAGERTLTEEELGLYMNGLEFFPKVTRSALKLALYLGGQRPSQLLRVAPSDVDITEDGGEIRIRDGKGARKTPRLHVLPLVGTAREIVEEMLELNSKEKFLFCNVKDTHVRIETMSEAVGELSSVLVECGRSKSPFQQRDIRRTCETLLAGMGISKDIRAQVLSHGLGGVQQRNYDRHEYSDEKRAALKAWDAKLEALRRGKMLASNVFSLETARAG